MLLQVSGSQLVLCVRVRWGGDVGCRGRGGGVRRGAMHMCIYGGGGRGNERDELMTICPLSCP